MTVQGETIARDPGLDGMIRLAGGTFRMGSDHHYPEEAPAHRVSVGAFWMDAAPVTNRDFARFVEETGYKTLAEIPPRAEDYPQALPHMLRAGSLMFSPPQHPVGLPDMSLWWKFQFGACWRKPYGPGSSIKGLDDHPVVHVAYRDAEAYATWAHKALPSEAEWEYAARGGLDGAEFAWGDAFTPGGRHMANTWQGDFPHENTKEDGYARTSPVGAFPANGYGLHDMIGNVWEWTANPGGPQSDMRVIKGGSYLCAANYCARYRPAARQFQERGLGTDHIGLRLVDNRRSAPN